MDWILWVLAGLVLAVGAYWWIMRPKKEIENYSFEDDQNSEFERTEGKDELSGENKSQ